MTTPDVIPIGSEVYYFEDVLRGETPIIKSMVLGSYVHKNEGELYYYLLNKDVPAYCVSETLEGARQQRDAFLKYREILLKANEETKKEYKKLKVGKLFEEYTVDKLPSEEKMEKEDAESTSSANDA